MTPRLRSLIRDYGGVCAEVALHVADGIRESDPELYTRTLKRRDEKLKEVYAFIDLWYDEHEEKP